MPAIVEVKGVKIRHCQGGNSRVDPRVSFRLGHPHDALDDLSDSMEQCEGQNYSVSVPLEEKHDHC